MIFDVDEDDYDDVDDIFQIQNSKFEDKVKFESRVGSKER